MNIDDLRDGTPQSTRTQKRHQPASPDHADDPVLTVGTDTERHRLKPMLKPRTNGKPREEFRLRRMVKAAWAGDIKTAAELAEKPTELQMVVLGLLMQNESRRDC